ncbi:MAG: hypothetical protein JWN75_411 [Candidatus Saccharibacteria bacterium]|nr:hypothetical protein [Candidatus Saccharibacteria bacterium]
MHPVIQLMLEAANGPSTPQLKKQPRAVRHSKPAVQNIMVDVCHAVGKHLDASTSTNDAHEAILGAARLIALMRNEATRTALSAQISLNEDLHTKLRALQPAH